MKLISWNVNGLRAVLRKNFIEYLESEQPDV
ncbi:MAG TPA: exodeoxyribonuclease III, partial [Verrucomicrobiae bacterium]